VLGTGSVSPYLSNDDKLVDTYLSRDAGYSWQRISAGGRFIYEFADHGALMLLAETANQTNSLMYTWNEGKTFQSCRFTDSSNVKVKVADIISEPSSKAQSFILHGTKPSQTSTVGVIIHIDFQAMHERRCEESDYEYWTPFDSFNSTSLIQHKCILGQETSYTRRKADSECYNGRDFEVASAPRQCPCVMSDYECDFCFEWNNGGCSAIDNCTVGAPSECDKYYDVSRGYRLVPENKCNTFTGLNLLPQRLPCPNSGKNGPSPGVIVLIVFIILFIFGASVGVLVFINRERIEAILKRRKADTQLEFDLDLNGSGTTALDDDLLEARPLDDSAIEQALSHPQSKKKVHISNFDF